uniref:hypothetical protein n=1 Tax=Cellulomonas hominis TaxID=156981 RepID=UPI0012B8CA01
MDRTTPGAALDADARPGTSREHEAPDRGRAGREAAWVAALTEMELGAERAVDLTVNTYGKEQQYDADAIALSFDRQATLIES